MKTKQEEINELRERLDALEKSLKEEGKERWIPKDKEGYFSIEAEGAIYGSAFRYSVDKGLVDSFNVFQTKEEADKIAKYQLIFRKLYDFAKRNNGEFKTGRKYGHYFGVGEGKARIDSYDDSVFQLGYIFSSEEVAKKAIEYIGEDDMKFYLTFQD